MAAMISAARHLGPAGSTHGSTLLAGKAQLQIDSETFLKKIGSARIPPILVNKFVEYVDAKGEIQRNPALSATDGKFLGTQREASGEAAESIFYKFLDKVGIFVCSPNDCHIT